MSWNLYKKWFMYVILLYLGGATVFTRYKMVSPQVDVGSVIAIVFFIPVVFAVFKRKINYRGFFLLLLFAAVWTILQCCKWGNVEIYSSLLWDLFAGFVICNFYKEDIFYYYEICISKLCRIAIVLWLLSWLLPFFPQLLIWLTPNWINALEESNILIFGLQPDYFSDALLFRRNCGFAWEPGRFASLISIAIFFNLVRTRFSVQNSNFKILLIALLSTQSTTGFSILITIIFAYLYNMNRKYFLPACIFSSLIVLVLSSLPFMNEKISSLWITKSHNIEFENKVSYWTLQNGETYVPQRFDGLLWEFYNIKQDPLLGYGKNISRSFTGETFNNKLVLYNGCLKVISILGIFWGLFYYIACFWGSAYYAKVFRFKGAFFAVLIFIEMNVSYPFQFEPVFLAMFFMPIYLRRNLRKEYLEKSNNNSTV